MHVPVFAVVFVRGEESARRRPPDLVEYKSDDDLLDQKMEAAARRFLVNYPPWDFIPQKEGIVPSGLDRLDRETFIAILKEITVIAKQLDCPIRRMDHLMDEDGENFDIAWVDSDDDLIWEFIMNAYDEHGKLLGEVDYAGLILLSFYLRDSEDLDERPDMIQEFPIEGHEDALWQTLKAIRTIFAGHGYTVTAYAGTVLRPV